ncbi:MAG: ScaI family restriction endonuclease [Treponema sp.]|nr:ScaI family restriction endonuclease [Treponema sp.]
MNSPYEGKPVSQWDSITNDLIQKSPLDEKEIISIVLEAWDKIKLTKIADELQVGIDVFPNPQIMGNYLHLMIAALLEKKHPSVWKREKVKGDKDVVCITDDDFSIEIKTSSQNKIFGNRSYGQENSDNNSGKEKYGYYLAVNFEKYTDDNLDPIVKQIKFGWIDHSDWKAQRAATGQNSTLDNDAWNHKLKLLYKNSR